MTTTIYKPVTRKGPVFLAPTDEGPPVIVTEDGREIKAVPANRAGGVFYNEGRYQWAFPREVIGLKNFKIRFGGKETTIDSGGQSYEGNAIDNWAPRDKGSVGSVPGGFNPGSDPTGLGFFPADLSGEFPSPVLSNYDPITAAPYDFTDVQEFAKEFGELNREEFFKNDQLAGDMALEALKTELAGLEGFIPGAAALKRGETARDNEFNQAQRDQAISRTLPFAKGDLEAQRGRANAFASGRVPDSITDRGLELGLRSAGADQAAVGGFGAASSASRSVQDLMSARERIGLSQYGDQLLTGNLREQERLFMAPTQYSDAGSQVRVMPSLSGSQLRLQNRGELNQATLLNPAQALQSQIQQNQYTTNLEQSTRQFNAGNLFAMSQFNAGVQNTFALEKFGYRVGLAGAVAGAFQTGSNAAIEIEQQNRAFELYEESLKAAQKLKTINSIFDGVLSIVGGAGGIGNILGGLSSLVGGGASAGGSVADRPVDIRPDFSNPETGPSDNDGFFDELDSGTPAQAPFGDDGFDIPENDPIHGIDLGDGPGNIVPFAARAAELKPTPAMRAAGISLQAGPNNIPAGYDTKGRQVYVDAALNSNNDTQYGAKVAQSLKEILTPFKVLSDKDASTLDKIIGTASDASFFATLADQYSRGDKKGFINAILNKYQDPAVRKITSNKQDRAGLNAAVDAAQLFANWDRMSPAQKSAAVANIGINAYKYGTGQDLRQLEIIKATANTPSLNVGQAMQLFNAGFNVYNLVDNWDQLNDVQKIAGGTGTVASVAAAARDFGLLEGGSIGASGAAAGSSGGIMGFPAQQAGVGSVLGPIGGAAGIALGADQLRKSWGQGGTRGAVNGALAGTSIGLGLAAMGAWNPYAFAGIVAVSTIGSAIKTGKEQNQVARDQVRKQYKKVGLVDDKFNLELPDGHLANLGIDGKGGRHEARDKAKMFNRDGKLYSYDIDYTNDLDYISGMGGIALSRIVSGGHGKNVDQMGGQLGNQALGKIGFGKDFTQSNFNHVMQNQRAMYAKAGVKSKADAYALTEQMYKEGRINESQAISMNQAFNMMYDKNGYETAQRLMEGRWRGLEVADKKKGAGSNMNPEKGPTDVRTPVSIPRKPGSIDPGFNRPFPNRPNVQSPNVNTELSKARPYMRRGLMTKEQVRAKNRERFRMSA